MTFKLDSQNVSSFLVWEKKHLVVPLSQLLSEARFHREGAKSAKDVEMSKKSIPSAFCVSACFS